MTASVVPPAAATIGRAVLPPARKIARKIRGRISDRRATERLLAVLDPADRALIAAIRERQLTYLSPAKLAVVASTCRRVEAAGLAGSLIEAGCALGGSTILIASTKSAWRHLAVHDVFGMIPPPTANDTPDVHDRYQTIVEGRSKGIGGDRYYGYQDDLRSVVEANLTSFGIELEDDNVELIEGLVQETLQVTGPVALAHVDVDWYEPVMTCLERIFPALEVSGSIILDDYYDWGGCRKATDRYLSTVTGQFSTDDSAGSLIVTRTRANQS